MNLAPLLVVRQHALYAAAYWSVVAQAQIHSWSSVTKHLHVVCYRHIW